MRGNGRGSWGEGQGREARAREGMRVRVGKGRQVREGAEEGWGGAGKGVKGGEEQGGVGRGREGQRGGLHPTEKEAPKSPLGPLQLGLGRVLPTSRFKETPLILGCPWATAATRVGGRRSRSRMRLGAAGSEAPSTA